MFEGHKRIYMSVYFLGFLIDGFLWILPGAIFVETQRQLGVSTGIMSLVVMSGSIGYILACIVSGYILDHYSEAHRWHSFISFMASIFITLLMFTDNIILAVIAFTIIGITSGTHDTYVFVFVLRLYPKTNANANIFFVALLLLVSATSLPLLLQFGIYLADTHIYPIIAFAGVALIESIGLILLKTPVHDKLRAIKRKVTSEINKNAISSVSPRSKSPTQENSQNQNKSNVDFETNNQTTPHHVEANTEVIDELCRVTKEKMGGINHFKMKQNILISLFISLQCIHGMMEFTFLTFTTTYCDEYLKMNDKVGRYLLSIYIGSGLFYRLMKTLLFRNMDPIYNMSIGFCIRLIVAVLFPFYGNSFPVLAMFYAISGWGASSIWPGVCACSESVRPITGFVSCLICVFYGIGGAVGITVVGELIDIYSANIFRFVLIPPALIAALTTTITLIMVKRYKKKRTTVVCNIGLADIKTDVTDTTDIKIVYNKK